MTKPLTDAELLQKAKQYLTNLGLWARGLRWCFTRRYYTDERPDVPVYVFPEEDCPPGVDPEVWGIRYKPGWGPWRFLPIYLTTYLAGTLCGFGVVSISRTFSDRKVGRLIDWVFWKLFRQKDHCANAGPWLWGSRSAWE